MISTILVACSVIIGGQIQCDVTNESKVILAGDIIYTKITMTNTFDHDIEAEPFQPVANYQIFVQANGIRGIAVGRPVGGLWSSDPAVLAPRQTLSTIAVYSPWEVFHEDQFNAFPELQRISKPAAEQVSPQRGLVFNLRTVTYPELYQNQAVINTRRVAHPPFVIQVDGYVLDTPLDVKYLYFSVSDREINKEYGGYGRLGAPHKQARSYGGDSLPRMRPVDWHFFDLPMNLYFRDPQHFSKLVTQVNPESKLYRVLHLIEMANDWVLTPDGAERTAKETSMLAYAAEGGPIEREFLTAKVKTLIGTKELEIGPYVPPTETP